MMARFVLKLLLLSMMLLSTGCRKRYPFEKIMRWDREDKEEIQTYTNEELRSLSEMDYDNYEYEEDHSVIPDRAKDTYDRDQEYLESETKKNNQLLFDR